MKKVYPDGSGMRYLGKQLQEALPADFGYCLLVFKYYDTGMANYVSSANRSDMVKALREAANRLEQGKEFPTPENN